MTISNLIEQVWYRRQRLWWLAAALLWPLSWIYRFGHFCRWFHPKTLKFNVPIVVIGNFTAGGSGKTPLIIAMSIFLAQQGKRVAVLSHAHLANNKTPREVNSLINASEFGDEATLIYARTRAVDKFKKTSEINVWVGRPRTKTLLMMLEKHPNIDLILVDDGLQDPSFARTIEVVWADSKSLGNKYIIPAGPLRQPLVNINKPSKVSQHRIVFTDAPDNEAMVSNSFKPPINHSSGIYPLANFHLPASKRKTISLEKMLKKPENKMNNFHLITAIAKPWRVLDALSHHKLYIYHHFFADHYSLNYQDIDNCVLSDKLANNEKKCVFITEKDAVKLLQNRQPKTCLTNIWVLDYHTELNLDFINRINMILM